MDGNDGPQTASGQSRGAEEQRKERARRIQALRDLAREQLGIEDEPPAIRDPTEGPAPSASRFPSRRRLSLFLLSALLLVAIVATVVWRVTRPPTRIASPSPLPVVTITPQTDGIGCPIGVAWSPDSTRVAVLGYAIGCPPQAGAHASLDTGIVSIYDVRRGRLLLTFQLDSTILRGHGVSLPSVTPSPELGPFAPFLHYDEILWSADGHQVAVPFFVQTGIPQQIPPYEPFVAFGYAPSPVPTLAGVLLTDVSSGSQRVITAPAPDSGARLEWDLTSGTLVSARVRLPPALGYQWGANGALLPQIPLNTMAPPTTALAGSIGNPTGGSQFSIWQPGVAVPGSYPASEGSASSGPASFLVAPDLYLWYSHFGAWSPDGRYLLTAGFLGGRVAPANQPAPTAETLTKADAVALPVLPARDAVVDELLSPSNPAVASAYTLQFVAWQPSGVEVAAVTDDEYNRQDDADVIHPIVTVYGSATARRLAQLQPQVNLQFASGNKTFTWQNILLKWSPDGRHLLLLDNNVGTLTIWNPAGLPTS